MGIHSQFAFIVTVSSSLCSVDCASRYINLKKNQLDAQIIFSIFRQNLHVSGESTAHQEVHCVDTTISTYCSF